MEAPPGAIDEKVSVFYNIMRFVLLTLGIYFAGIFRIVFFILFIIGVAAETVSEFNWVWGQYDKEHDRVWSIRAEYTG